MRRPGPRRPDAYASAPAFIRALSRARLAADLTQEALAEAAGLPPSVVQRLEAGQAPIRPAALAAAAAALGYGIALTPLNAQSIPEPEPEPEPEPAKE